MTFEVQLGEILLQHSLLTCRAVIVVTGITILEVGILLFAWQYLKTTIITGSVRVHMSLLDMASDSK